MSPVTMWCQRLYTYKWADSFNTAFIDGIYKYNILQYTQNLRFEFT